MSKNGIILSVLLVVFAAAYVNWFTYWFRTETIQIVYTIRPVQVRTKNTDPNLQAVYPVNFGFQRKIELTSIKVVAADDLATNKHPAALWHLVTESNSVPTKSFIYGHPIKGMTPAVARVRPEPLQPDVNYVLLVESGKIHAQTTFHTVAPVVPQ